MAKVFQNATLEVFHMDEESELRNSCNTLPSHNCLIGKGVKNYDNNKRINISLQKRRWKT